MRQPSLGRILHFFCPEMFGLEPRAAIVTGTTTNAVGTVLANVTIFYDYSRDKSCPSPGFELLRVIEPQTNEQRAVCGEDFWLEWPTTEPAGQREVPAPDPKADFTGQRMVPDTQPQTETPAPVPPPAAPAGNANPA